MKIDFFVIYMKGKLLYNLISVCEFSLGDFTLGTLVSFNWRAKYQKYMQIVCEVKINRFSMDNFRLNPWNNCGGN